MSLKHEENKDNEEFNFYIEYPYNVIESFVVLVIIRAIVDKPIDFYNITKASLIIGILICIATIINKEFKKNIRSGLHYGVSSVILSQFTV